MTILLNPFDALLVHLTVTEVITEPSCSGLWHRGQLASPVWVTTGQASSSSCHRLPSGHRALPHRHRLRRMARWSGLLELIRWNRCKSLSSTAAEIDCPLANVVPSGSKRTFPPLVIQRWESVWHLLDPRVSAPVIHVMVAGDDMQPAVVRQGEDQIFRHEPRLYLVGPSHPQEFARVGVIQGPCQRVIRHEDKPHVAAVQIAPGVHDQAELALDRAPPLLRREYG